MNAQEKQEMEQLRQWSDTLRQLNKSLEEQCGLKEHRIAHLEIMLGTMKDQLTGLMRELSEARRILVGGFTAAQRAILPMDD